jgi:membrane-bound serine protease (ClpP class)
MRSHLPLRFRLILLTAWAFASFSGGLARAQTASDHALLLTLDGPLTPAMITYLDRGLAQAQTDQAALVILQLNTPGGQINHMEKMVASIRNSAVPVVVYVAPRGAIAGSAGTLITVAGHASAMAPETAIGAASPIGGQGENLESTADRKAKEALKALARSLVERRGPQAVELVEATIESAKAVTAEEARAAGLIDVIAADIPDLVRQLDETQVQVNGQTRTLLTSGLIVDEFPMSLVETVLNLLTDPNIIFVLTSLGTWLIIIEVQTPGGWIAGLAGVTCLLLAFYGLGALPVNWFGLIFVILAFILIIAEIYNPATFGALTIAGAASLVVGALVLFNSPGSLPFFQVNVPLVIGTAVVFAGLSLAVMAYALRTIRRPPLLGPQTLLGQVGEMRSGDSVYVGGELWTAEPANGPLSPGDKVEVTAIKGLKLIVRKK